MKEPKPSRQPGDIAIRVFHAKGGREEAEKQGADMALYDRLHERYGNEGLPPSQFFAPARPVPQEDAAEDQSNDGAIEPCL